MDPARRLFSEFYHADANVRGYCTAVGFRGLSRYRGDGFTLESKRAHFLFSIHVV